MIYQDVYTNGQPSYSITNNLYEYQDISVDKHVYIVYTIQYNNKNNSKGYYEIYMDDTNRIKCVLDT